MCGPLYRGTCLNITRLYGLKEFKATIVLYNYIVWVEIDALKREFENKPFLKSDWLNGRVFTWRYLVATNVVVENGDTCILLFCELKKGLCCHGFK